MMTERRISDARCNLDGRVGNLDEIGNLDGRIGNLSDSEVGQRPLSFVGFAHAQWTD